MTTELTTRQNASSMAGRLAKRAAEPLQKLSDRVHVGGDAFACEHGWAIASATGRLGFTRRVYRDPRFDQRTVTRRAPDRTGWRPNARAG
jgi:hypothetical protein